MEIEVGLWLLWQAREHFPGLSNAMPELAPLFQVGAIGAILAFLLLKTEPRLRGMEAAIDRNSRALMLSLLAGEQVSAALKAQAQALLEELHDADLQRGGGKV